MGLFGSLSEIASATVTVRAPLWRRPAFLIPVGLLSTALLVLGFLTIRVHRRDTAALRISEAQHRALMQQASDAIFVCNLAGEVLDANRRAHEIAGSERPPEGLALEELLRTESGEPWLDAALASTGNPVVPLTLERSSGGRLAVEASIKLLDDRRVLAIVRDLTERRRLEEERLAFERQLTESQKLESLGRLAGGFAHDFNNLLMLIMGHSDQAIAHLDEVPVGGSGIERDLARVVQAAQRAGDLTEKLLAFAGRETIEPRPVDLNQLLLEIEDLLQTSIGRGVALRLELEPDVAPVEGDPGRLRQVVLNLVTNASEALEGGRGQVTLRTCPAVAGRDFDAADLETERAVALEVVDDGPGMDASTRERAFEPFFTTRFQGRGLGLAAVQGIVRSHRGTIRLETEEERGTRVTVLLPELARDVPWSAPRARQPVEGDLVLVVDDEPGVCQVVAAMLRRAGVQTLIAHGGPEALELFREHADRIAASIVDVTMPEMDGLEVRERMLAERPDAIVHLMSGYSEMVAPARDSLGGQTLFLRKPFSSTELLAHLRLTQRDAASV